jgi:tRNA (uracil-5-)-methyltransferase TRM9
MKAETARTLLELNQHFYQDFGRAFAATRRRVQPGMMQAARQLASAGSWLDLGCGSGELARHLVRSGFQARYLGLDGSAELLAEARQDAPAPAEYRQADLSQPGWAAGLEQAPWQIISCFAVLHHLPGVELRARVLQQARLLLAEDGRFVHSVWQFQHSAKLMARRQPWERIGLAETDVEAGDSLLDWRYALPGQPEQTGLRYVHLFSRTELSRLAESCGFHIDSEFESDGEGGKLGLYQVWSAD